MYIQKKISSKQIEKNLRIIGKLFKIFNFIALVKKSCDMEIFYQSI